jgi:two-component system sensor histidine kinase RegB
MALKQSSMALHALQGERWIPMPRDRVTAAPPPIGPGWLITVRWTALAAGLGAVAAGRVALEVAIPVVPLVVATVAWVTSNLWLMWWARGAPAGPQPAIWAWLICLDVGLLSWLLLFSGGVLNPASIFYLVEIVFAALVLSRRAAWLVTALCVIGYAALYLTPTVELRAAVTMHREIALHMRGMWLAFAVTAVILALLVSRLVAAVENRDRALEELRARTARMTQAASLATLAAGAAHELSTPLATIAVAAHELERDLVAGVPAATLEQDAKLIRAEADRCRHVLDAMAVRSGQPSGETPRAGTVAELLARLEGRLTPADWARLDLDVADIAVVWPFDTVARALLNLVQNAVQADPAGRVSLVAAAEGEAAVRITVADRGSGMDVAVLRRAGEPFFTTKAGGTGLGMFVARSTVEQLGGTLDASSRPGAGTTVDVSLPLNVVAGTP